MFGRFKVHGHYSAFPGASLVDARHVAGDKADPGEHRVNDFHRVLVEGPEEGVQVTPKEKDASSSSRRAMARGRLLRGGDKKSPFMKMVLCI